jgi:phage antirepressor YoqD-like protein
MVELEQKPAFDYTTVLGDASMMRGLLLTYTEKVIALESTVKILEPKAIALDRISSGEGSQCITDSAKALKMQPKKLFSFLQEVHWIYKRAGGKSWLGYQDKIQQGLVEHKITTVTRSDGSEKVIEQVLLMPKGITKLSEMLSAHAN